MMQQKLNMKSIKNLKLNLIGIAQKSRQLPGYTDPNKKEIDYQFFLTFKVNTFILSTYLDQQHPQNSIRF